MAHSNPQPNGSSHGSPSGKKKPTKVKRPKTDLSAFLNYPIGTMGESEFAQLCEQIRAVVAPQTDFEELGVEAILWSFRRIRDAEKAIAQGVKGARAFYKHEVQSFRGCQRTLDLSRELFEAERQYEESRARASQSPPSAGPPTKEPASPSLILPSQQDFWRPARATPKPEAAPEPEPAPGPTPAEDESFEDIDELEAASEDWRARIAMVPAVDPRWPVLDQFDIRVDDVLNLRDRGVSEEEVLEQYPGLTFMDLAACYSCEVEGYRGPLEPPYPADITLVDDNADSD